MSQRQNFSSGGKREPTIGYSRAVRIGPMVLVAGCTAYGPDGETVGVGDMYAQARQTLKNVEAALALAGAELRHVVRTRVYMTDIGRWEEAARAHGEVFGQIRPVSTFLGISSLVTPDRLIEIDADAYIDD